MRKLINKIRSRGISLPEALVMVIIVGYALVPIIGTFNNTTHRATKFEHTEKLRILARSRMNKEIAASGYDQSAVDLTTMYHYEYYDDQTPPNKLSMATTTLPVDFEAIATVSSILYAYKVSVELKEQLQLATYTSPITDSNSEYLRNITGLKAIVVTAEIDPDYVVATQSVSYFTLISSPKHQGNFMYVCDSNDLAIKVIDPVSKSVAETFQIPKADPSDDYDDDNQDPVRPWNIAVHPNGRVLVYQSKQKVFAINIDHASDHYGESAPIYNFGHDISSIDGSDATKAIEDRGIAFRPDGRYLYVSDHDNKVLHVLEPHGFETKPITWPPLNCSLEFTTTPAYSDNKFGAIHSGNDGWLYLAESNSDTIHRIRMFPSNMGSPQTETQNSLNGGDFYSIGIKTTVDGKYVYATQFAYNPTLVLKFRSEGTKGFELIGSATFKFDASSEETKSLELSDDDKYLFLTDPKGASGQSSAFVYNISNLNWQANPITDVAMTEIHQSEVGADYLCLSPNNNDIAWISEPGKCHFANIASAANGDFTSSLPAQNTVVVTSTDKALSDIVKRNIQYCLVGCSDATIKYLDIYGGFIDENKEVTNLRGSKPPVNISIMPHGEKFMVGYGSTQTGADTYKFNNKIPVQTSQGAANVYYTSFIATDSYAKLFITGEHHPSVSWRNGYWSPNTPIPTLLVNNKCRDVDVSTDWVVKQVVSLNKGGFLILFSNDGSKGTPAGTTMLDWIGEHKWNSDPRKAGDGSQTWPQYKGTYERFARWYSSADHNFPPKYATKMAISFDDSLLAFSTKKPSDCRIYIYDFNAQNFGALTQMEGLITEAHSKSGVDPAHSFDVPVDNASRFSGAGIKLNESFTANATPAYLVHLKIEPLNFYNNTSTTPPCPAYSPDACAVRTFGYFRPIHEVYSWGSHNADGARLFLKDATGISSFDYDWDGSYNTVIQGGDSRVVGTNTSCLIQLEHCANQGNPDGQSIMYTDISGHSWATPSTDYSKPYFGPGAPGWQHVVASETMPFLFRPQCLFNKQFSIDGTPSDAPMVFGRDVADPILYLLDGNYDGLFTVRLGYGMHKIKLPGADYLNTDLAISPDGQTLIAGKEDSPYRVYTINISSPYTKPNGASYDFGSNINPTVAGTVATATGYVTASITLPVAPTCLATLPYRHYYSKRDVYEPLSVTLPSDLANPNGAAVASGGIYFLGGGTTLGSVSPRNLIWRFNPIDNSISSLSVALNKAVKKNSVVSYNDEIYSFGGDTASAYSPCDWVQRYCIASNSVESSFDPVVGSDEIKVSQNNFTNYSMPGPASTTDSGNIYATYYGWQLFKGSIAFGDGWITNVTSNGYVDYDAGSDDLAFIANKIRVCNTISPSGDCVKNISINAKHNSGDSWTNIAILSVPQNTDKYLDFFNETPYRYYQFYASDNYGGTEMGVRELEYWLTGLRKVSPSNMTAWNSPSPFEVTQTAGHENVWNAFDGQVTDTHWCNNGVVATLTLNLGTGDVVDIIRVKYNNTTNLNFKFAGSNGSSTGPWTPLAIGGSLIATDTDNSGSTFATFAVSNTNSYQYYAFCVVAPLDHNHIWELEYYSTTPVPPKQNILTKTIGDDLQSFKMAFGAACTTPYGIFYAGGRDDTGTTTDTALLYWPQAIATTTAFGSNYSQFGISRELPPMPNAVNGHCLVWHKGKVYRIGGSDNAGASGALENIDVYDSETNTWSTIDSGSTPPFPAHFRRYVAAACSYGDEIFIFGGKSSGGTTLTSAYAWNPETGTERRLHDLPNNNTVGMTAVPCAGAIYLFGGASGLSSSGSNQIIKYTP